MWLGTECELSRGRGRGLPAPLELEEVLRGPPGGARQTRVRAARCWAGVPAPRGVRQAALVEVTRGTFPPHILAEQRRPCLTRQPCAGLSLLRRLSPGDASKSANLPEPQPPGGSQASVRGTRGRGRPGQASVEAGAPCFFSSCQKTNAKSVEI